MLRLRFNDTLDEQRILGLRIIFPFSRVLSTITIKSHTPCWRRYTIAGERKKGEGEGKCVCEIVHGLKLNIFTHQEKKETYTQIHSSILTTRSCAAQFRACLLGSKLNFVQPRGTTALCEKKRCSHQWH